MRSKKSYTVRANPFSPEYVAQLLAPAKPVTLFKDNADIAIGDFITGEYKCGTIDGAVCKITKSKIFVHRYAGRGNEYTETGVIVPVTRTRVRRVLSPDEYVLIKK